MDKRNKLWRRQQMARVFKARMILYAAYGHCIIREDGSYYEHPHWFELAKTDGRKFIKRQVLRVAVGCVEVWNITARSIRKKLCVLFGNQWSNLKG